MDADELGSRFLRDATEQGDFDPERAWSDESSLIDAPAGDEPLSGTHFGRGTLASDRSPRPQKQVE